jgi:hypothetical protein
LKSPLATLAVAAAVLVGFPAGQVLWTTPVEGTVSAAHIASRAVQAATPTPTPTPSPAPQTGWHFAPNYNFDASWNFRPGVSGFNLADVNSATQLPHLPKGVKAIVFVGRCTGVDTGFLSKVQPFLGSHQVFGYYLMDDPDPTLCPAANLRAEADWLQANSVVSRTFIVLMNQGAPSAPAYSSKYKPANSHVDLFGIDMYPCRSELSGCANWYIPKAVKAAEAAGMPQQQLVPVYQAFGGGTWTDGAGGQYLVPTAKQEANLVRTWASVLPTPVFDYAYSWGCQRQDIALAKAPNLQQFFAGLYGV